jgi:hypothetical protein
MRAGPPGAPAAVPGKSAAYSGGSTSVDWSRITS